MLSQQNNDMLTRVGPGTPMGNLLRCFWIPALLEEEIVEPDGAPVKLRLLGEDLVAFRSTSGKVGIVEAYCAHRRAPLCLGRNEENGLRCVYHGWKYDLDGNCVDLPAAGDKDALKERIKIAAYPTREHGGVIWVYMGPREKMPQLPDFEWTRLPKMQRTSTKRLQRCNWAQVVEGGIDSAHVSFLHRSKHGKPTVKAPGESGKSTIQESTPDKYLMMDGKPVFDSQEVEHGLMISARRSADEGYYYWRVNQFVVPFYTIIPPHLSNQFTDSSQAAYYGHVYVPIDDENTWNWSFTASPHAEYSKEEWDFQGGKRGYWGPVDNNYHPLLSEANNYLLDLHKQRTESYTGIDGIPNQDAAVQEGMGPIVDRTKEHLVNSDRGVSQFRRLMLRLAKELMEGKEPAAAAKGALFNVRSVTCVLPTSVPIWEGAKHLFLGTAAGTPPPQN
ncbi:MAG: phthalate 4,5-dioxygenase [Alphaproteobacteria bacterium]|nr:phthalate 4,5-dioxygenase [Alphaproteobacteria bacterium]